MMFLGEVNNNISCCNGGQNFFLFDFQSFKIMNLGVHLGALSFRGTTISVI